MAPNFPPWSVKSSYYKPYNYDGYGRKYQDYDDFTQDDVYSNINKRFQNNATPYNRENNHRYQAYSQQTRFSQQTNRHSTRKYPRSYQDTTYALLRRDPPGRNFSYPPARLIACYTCGEQFSNKTALFAHRNEVHSKANYYCSICNKQFSVLRLMKEHEKTHTIQACTECPEVFKFKDSLLAHKEHAHSIPPPAVEPARSVHAIDKSGFKNFISPVAASTPAQSFSDSSQDSGVHVKIEAHACPQCIKSFDSEEKLQSHSKIHTNQPLEARDSTAESQPSDKLACPLCIKTFCTRRELMLHLDAAHTQVYYCRKCPAEFASQKELIAHSNVHS